MNWFDGTISAAITTAKNKNSIFLVFVHVDKDDNSEKMKAVFEDKTITNKLQTADVVAIKIESNSTECKQFSQIYPVVVLPASYFITPNGIPLDIIGGFVESADFIKKFDEILEEHMKQIQPKKESSPANIPEPSNVSKATGSTQTTPQATTSETTDAVQRAQDLISIQKEKKAQEEREKEKQKELERIQLGKEMQNFKSKQKEEEDKKLAKDIAKEKEDDRKAREKVKAQIEKDRQERAARFNQEKLKLENKKKEDSDQKLRQESKEAANLASQRSTMARLQFRLPDGSAINETFPASEPLQTAHSFLLNRQELGLRSFSLSTSYPRKTFTRNDMSMSLRDLQLAPSAVVIVLPERSVLSNPNVGVSNLIWMVMKPFMYIYGLIHNFLFGQADPPQTDPNNRKRNQQANDQAGSSQVPKRRAVSKSNSSVKQGNVHQLQNDDDEDDENNTWNGNSTQQL